MGGYDGTATRHLRMKARDRDAMARLFGGVDAVASLLSTMKDRRRATFLGLVWGVGGEQLTIGDACRKAGLPCPPVGTEYKTAVGAFALHAASMRPSATGSAVDPSQSSGAASLDRAGPHKGHKMGVATGQRVRSVHIERADGMQSNLDEDTRVYDRNGLRITLADIPGALTDPAGWIDFDTEAERRAPDDDEREPWQVDAESETWPARARIYARAVVEVMVVYDNKEV